MATLCAFNLVSYFTDFEGLLPRVLFWILLATIVGGFAIWVSVQLFNRPRWAVVEPLRDKPGFIEDRRQVRAERGRS